MSIVPSLRPSITASLSASVLIGGLTLASVPFSSTMSSVSEKCCGVDSACTSAPSFLAVLTSSTDTAELMCCIHIVALVSSAIIQSRATIIYSEQAGAPPILSLSDTTPLLIPCCSIYAGFSS